MCRFQPPQLFAMAWALEDPSSVGRVERMTDECRHGGVSKAACTGRGRSPSWPD